MADASEGWKGRSGRQYSPADEPAPHRSDSARSTHPAFASGPPIGDSMVSDGAPVAIYEPVVAEDESWKREVEVYRSLSETVATPPLPRVFDVLETGALVTEWCPFDMEKWWLGVMNSTDGIRGLLQAITECCRRADDYNALVSEDDLHPQFRPKTIVRRGDGRWLLTRLGHPQLPVTAGETFDEGLLFTAPEVLFSAKGVRGGTTSVWGLGCCLLVLLRLRAFRKKGASVPVEGSDSAVLRSHRATLVADLVRLKPSLFKNRELNPKEFLYPDVLPEPDKTVVMEALKGEFADDEVVTALQDRIIATLERCLFIDPNMRFQSPGELATELDGIIRWYRESRIKEKNAPRVQPPPTVPAASTHVAQPVQQPGSISETHRAFLVERIQTLEERLDVLEGRKAPSLLPLWGVVALLGCVELAGMFISTPEPENVPSSTSIEVVAPSTESPREEPQPSPPTLEPATDDTTPPQAPEDRTAVPPPSVVPAATPSVRTVTTTPAPAEPSEEGFEEGVVVVQGAYDVYLVDGQGERVPPGPVSVGNYTVFGTMDGVADSTLVSVSVTAGQTTTVKCGFGTCRIID